jgi:CubicO group peptidase (beta-lactamase class C family)
VTVDRTPVPTAEELGLMRGTPPVGDRLVTLGNWTLPPWNRWGLQHVGELIPCAPVPHGDHVWQLPSEDRRLEHIGFDLDGERWTWWEMLRATATDAIAVLHRGTLVFERYLNGMTPSTRHLCFSLTKSVVATLTGILAGRGAMDAAGRLTDLIPELAGTSWEGATVQHVLDMRTGTLFDEVYAEFQGDSGRFGQVLGFYPRTDPTLPVDTYSFLAALSADREHGGRFDYRSPVTSMLGWLCERAGGDRLPALLSREVWLPLGAEADGAITVDAHGNAFAGGGFSATLRDLARFGELWRLGGVVPDGTRVVPEAWVADTVSGGVDSRAAFAAQADFEPDPAFPDAFYRNKWWVLDPAASFYTAIGIYGQWITVDGEAELVVARLSSQALADDESHGRLYLAGLRAIARELRG